MKHNLAEINAAVEAATPGPWDYSGMESLVEASDAEFIALSRTAVPWLVDRVEELAEALAYYVDLEDRGVVNTAGQRDARAALARLEGE